MAEAGVGQLETKRSPLYERVAARINAMIGEGALKPGDRIPSIRTLSRQLRVSVNTVKEAYELLETRRIVSARPQSGYYVTGPLPELPRAPEVVETAVAPAEITNGALLQRIMAHFSDATLLPLGLGIPNPALLPAERLSRMIATQARTHPARSVGYLPPPGDRRLREQIARRALLAGCALKPEEIVITSGCLEAVGLALRALCRPGDTVALESPTFFSFFQTLESFGLRVLEIPATPREGMSLDVLRYALKHNAVRACVAITNFTNPLGSVMPVRRKEELVKVLAEHGVALIEDDINGDLSFEEPRPPVARAADDNVILCSSFSKTVAPGYRIGWIAASKLHGEIQRLKFISNVSTASPTQMAMAEFLDNGGYDRHLRAIRRAYAANVAAMGEAIGRLFPPGTRVTRPAGGYVLWIELPERLDSLELYRRALERGISIAPGPLFSCSGGYNGYFRLSAAVWDPVIEQAVRTLGDLARELAARPAARRRGRGRA
jgi:DNA-binding transcriptional MocR family regulator